MPNPERIRHLVITPFAIRGLYSVSTGDPLAPRRLRRRLALLEVTAAPSLLGQRRRDFGWIVLVDPGLGHEARRRLRRIVGGHPDARLVDWEPSFPERGLEWLRSLWPAESRWYLTTTLDDDDALSAGFVGALQRQARRLIRGEDRPLHLFGCERVLQWDCVPSAGQPLGSTYAWRRALPPAAGFSVLSDTERMDLSVLAFSHHLARRYRLDVPLDGLPEVDQLRVGEGRDRIRAQLRGRGLGEREAKEILDGGLYHPVESEGLQAVISSHGANLRAQRMFEGRAQRRPVRDVAAFGDVRVDLEAVERHASELRLGVRELMEKVLQAYRLTIQEEEGAGWRVKHRAAANALDLLGSWRRWRKVRAPTAGDRSSRAARRLDYRTGHTADSLGGRSTLPGVHGPHTEGNRRGDSPDHDARTGSQTHTGTS